MCANKNVIDNENIKLIEHLKDTLPSTKKASIAVGYFFISGFAKIMNSFNAIESSIDPDYVIRLLISPTTNKATTEALLASNESYEAVRNSKMEYPDKGEGVSKAKDEIRRMLEYMPQTEDDRSAALKIKDLIRKKKLQVKVYTREKLHAKAYIFESMHKNVEPTAIVGSSNLSVAGISDNTELNLRTTHSVDSKDLLAWFNRHWNDDSCSEFTQEMAKIIDSSWIGRHDPVDVYHKALLHEHDDKFNLGVIKYTTGPNTKKLFDFQKVAVAHAIKKLENFGGVMISDVVGTGKTLIGTAILRHLVSEYRSNPLVICPPHLKSMWEQYLHDYGISGSVLSRYKIGLDENLLPMHSNHDVILIDESHNFRSKNTQSYKALAAFMEEKTEEARIIMLSATPISNKLTDLKNQLALFPREMISKIDILGTITLDEYFKKTTNPDGTPTDSGILKIRELLRYILIRRTRTEIKEKYAKYDINKKLHYLVIDGKKKYFPNRVLKNPREYDIEKVYNNEFQSITEALGMLKLARYNPGEYIREEYLNPTHPKFQKYDDLRDSSLPLVGIVRTSLLKRVESSIKAFYDSTNNYLEGHRLFKLELEKGNVPIGREFHDVIYRSVTDADYDDTDYEKDLAEIKSSYDADAFEMERWIADIKHDSEQFAKMKGYLGPESKFATRDDKLAILVDLLKDMTADKVLIFSESASTARYIAEHLGTKKTQKKIQNRVIEQIDSGRNMDKGDVIWRFDPDNNPKPRKSINREEIDILVSTDVLSEGVNLQSGRIVINYDFHWNPVRLIQRVGRVDRIGTKHEQIDIVNFLPTTKGEKELGLKERVGKKIELIRSIMGSDQRILEDTETFDPKSIEGIYAGDDSILDVENVSGILDISDTRADKDSDKIRNDENLLQRVYSLPFGMRSATGHEALVAACEAEETMARPDGKHVMTKKFKKYYHVHKNEAVQILRSEFLKLLGENSSRIKYVNTNYDRLVEITWENFSRDMSDAVAGNPRLFKHQAFFVKKLKSIPKKSGLKSRATRLLPFVIQRMVTNDEPYKSLAGLHKKIDAGTNISNADIILELESIKSEHANVTYVKSIRKPKILYSMMVTDGVS